MADQTPQTIEITNFGGRLTRILNGDLNSGMAKFTQSWGYDPFSKPMNLTWLEQPVDISAGMSDCVLAGKTHIESGNLYVYAIGHLGNLYKIQPNSGTSGAINANVDSVIGIASVKSGTSFNFGASMEFYGASEKIYIGHDNQVNSINFDGSAETKIGNTANYLSNTFRPLKQFSGKLIFGNGPTVGVIDANTATVTSSVIGMGTGGSANPSSANLYSQFNPPLSPETRTQELDVSVDGNQLLVVGSSTATENIMTASNDRVAAAGSDGAVYKWNGSDVTITALNSIPSYALTAMQTYLGNNMFFSNDSFGASLNDGATKILTLSNNKSPLPNSTATNGNFVSWVSPEVNPTNTAINASLYYFGGLDAENPPGLYRLLRYSTGLADGVVYQTPFNILTNNKYMTVNNTLSASSILTLGLGKHYFSTYEVNPTASVYGFKRFLVTPTGSGTPNTGVYETQTQLFSEKATIKQIRVYTEPTATGNGFQVDCIGGDGAVITNGSFTYSFAAGTDITLLQGALERINFNPAMKSTFALGLRITNTGTTNMTIRKIEVDWLPSGK